MVRIYKLVRNSHVLIWFLRGGAFNINKSFRILQGFLYAYTHICIYIYLNRKERGWDTHRVFLSEVLDSSGKHKIDEGPSSAPSNSYRVCAVGPEVCYSLFETWKSTQHVVLLE